MNLSQFVQVMTLSSGCALVATLIAWATDLWRGRK